MVHLVSHFGDQEDSGAPCGLCDSCAPERSITAKLCEPEGGDAESIARILAALARTDGQATGKLYLEAFADRMLDRRSFEHVLNALCQAGLVSVVETTFEKDGKAITYQRAELTLAGRKNGAASATVILHSTPTKTATKRRVTTKKTKSVTKASKKSKWFFVNRAKSKKKAAKKA